MRESSCCHSRAWQCQGGRDTGVSGEDVRAERDVGQHDGQGQGEVPAGGQGTGDQDGRTRNQVLCCVV